MNEIYRSAVFQMGPPGVVRDMRLAEAVKKGIQRTDPTTGRQQHFVVARCYSMAAADHLAKALNEYHALHGEGP